MYPVAILAGGLGTRLAGLGGGDLPKAMLPVAGRPFIDFKLAGLRHQGVDRVVMLVGHGADALIEHVGDGSRFGLQVEFLTDGPRLLGTGGALRRAVGLLGDVFWVTYGDTYLRAPTRAAQEAFDTSGKRGLMTVLHNYDKLDRSNLDVAGGLVTKYDKTAPAGTYEWIDYGFSILTSGSLLAFQERETFDLQEPFSALIRDGQMAAFEVTERFYEIGTPQSYRETDEFLRSTNEWERVLTVSQ